jgi:transcriptional regulator with XRE-family HTH domain
VILGDRPIGEVIVQLRANRGMTREELAAKAGLLVRTIGRIENGTYGNCHWHTILQILTQGFGLHIELTYTQPEEGADGQLPFPPNNLD